MYQLIIGLSLIVGLIFLVKNVDWASECSDLFNLFNPLDKDAD